MKINLRESLNKIDLATNNKYDLLNTFDSKKLSDNSKKKLAEAIENNSMASVNRILHESEEQLYKVVIQSGAIKRDFESALYEDEAEEIVDYYGGRWIDENGFEWNMYVEEDDDSTEHAMIDNSYDMEDDDERAQREMDAYDQSDRDWEYVESLKESYEDFFEIETNLRSNSKIKMSSGSWKVDTIYLMYDSAVDNAPHLIGYAHDDDGNYDRDALTADEIVNCDLSDYMDYIDVVDVERMIKDNPKYFYTKLNDGPIKFDESAKRSSKSLKEASYGGAYDIDDNMFFTKEDIVEFADNICEDLAKEFGYKYDIADVYMDSPTKLHIELIDNHDIKVDINVRIDMRRIKKPSDLEKAYHNSTLESFKNRFLEEYQYYEFDESLKESIDISDYEELHYPLRDGDKYYQLYRKIEDGKGVWAAAELDKYGSDVVGEPFKITYEQARGFEPIEDSSIRKLSRDLGKKLLPKRENLNEAYRPLAIGYMILKKEIPNHVNYAEFANYDEVVTAIPSEGDVVVYPRSGKISGTDIAYWQFDAIDSEGKKTKANFDTYVYSLKDFLNNDEMELKLIPDFKLIDEYPYLIEVDDDIEESLTEDTIKQNGKWVNKGSEGTHGKFKTKKAADAQRKAMFANGYKVESLDKKKYSSGNYFLTVEETGMGPHYSLYYQHPHSGYDGLMFIEDGYGYDHFKERLLKFKTVYPNKDVQNLLKNINESKSVSTIGKALLPKKESLKESNDENIEDKVAVFTKGIDGKSYYHGFMDREEADKHYTDRLKEAIDDEIDLNYEADFDDDGVEEGNVFVEGGVEYAWIQREAGPLYLDFDKWAVWSAREYVDPRDFITIHDDGKGYDFDGDAFKKKAMAAPITYFVVDEDTGFIDWGPEDNEIAAKDFLNGKKEDWENDMDESLNEDKELKEYYSVNLHYEDIGDGREYDYEADYDDVLEYLMEHCVDDDNAPEDTQEYMEWVVTNFDYLFKKYEYDLLKHFYEDASQEEYDERHSSYEPEYDPMD